MNNEKLKISLCGYYLSDVKVSLIGSNEVFNIDQISKNAVRLGVNNKGVGNWYKNTSVLMYLFPISSITKPIQLADYNNGEPFVPVVELARKAISNLSVGSFPDYMDISSNIRIEVVFNVDMGWYFGYDLGLKSFTHGITIKNSKYQQIVPHNQLELFDLLNRWKIDYRGLINEGLAIEVNEKNNPYL